MPIPAVLIRPSIAITGPWCDDMIAVLEVLSPLSRNRDMRWKRHAYSALPSLQHDGVLHQEALDMRAFDRGTSWDERRVMGLDATLTLPILALALPDRSLYAGAGPV